MLYSAVTSMLMIVGAARRQISPGIGASVRYMSVRMRGSHGSLLLWHGGAKWFIVCAENRTSVTRLKKMVKGFPGIPTARLGLGGLVFLPSF